MESNPAQLDRPVAITTSGAVRGERVGAIRRFLGIPYAAPPVAERRFAAPQPHDPWSEVREATAYGPCAPQTITPFPALDAEALVGDGGTRGDDYLSLNIWAPADGEARPVMVFIHGGGFVIGSKDAPVSDGAAFARDGVVCVAINYRLGIQGFVPIPGVPTNLGLRDQLFALRWVQDNIAAFGGDPANVTVFGESAGAMAIADLVTSPLAQGLFRRAIVESGHGGMVRDIGIAQRLVQKLARVLKIAPTPEGFASKSVDDLLAAQAVVSNPKARINLRDAEKREPVFGISRFIPVYGDDVLPEKPHDALAKGAGKDIQVLIGSNRDEMNLYFVPTGVRAKVNRLLAWYVVSRSQPKAGQVLRAYGMGRKGISAGDAFTRAMTDLVFRWPARRFAELHQGTTHMYEFEWRSPACDGELGACHGIELPFVFDTLATARGERGLAGVNPPQELAERVHALWVRFATDGSLPWQPFDADHRQVYQLAAGAAISEPVMPVAPFLP